jgi:hypothetical protein
MQLSADIDSGRTGDKNPALDPSLAPLGTDDEAAGTPANAFSSNACAAFGEPESMGAVIEQCART